MNTRKAYDSDLNDLEWKIIEPLIAGPKPRGRKITYPRREILNAIFYLVRNGCGWRNLPHDLPPFKLVSYYYQDWRRDQSWQAINDVLRGQLRQSEGHKLQPSAAIIDSQSVKTTEVRGERGYDVAKKSLSVQIVGGGGDYVWIIKGNQKGVLEDIEILFEESEPVPAGCSATPTDFVSYRQVDKGHGRLEERTITISNMLKDYTPFPHLEQVFRIESRVTRGAKTTLAVRYGLTSLPREVADAKRLLELVRGEWAIENRLHYRRDNILREDWSQARLGQAPQVLATLNNTILSLLDKRGVKNVAKARHEFAFNPTVALKLLLA